MSNKNTEEDSTEHEKSNINPEEGHHPELSTPVSPMKLFKFATTTDHIMLTIATLCSILNGLSQPLLYLVFSDIVGLFGTFQKNSLTDSKRAGEELQSSVNIMCITFVGIGLGTMVVAYLQMFLWSMVGERQAFLIRNKYYRATLSQEMGWFDRNSSGDVATRLASNVSLVQEGISDKLGVLIQYLATFIGGFIIAFIKGWKLTLVLLSVVPLIAACGIMVGRSISKTNLDDDTSGSASSIASEVISSIRTVYSFNATKKEIQRYTKAINDTRKIGIKNSILSGLSLGSILGILFFSYALAMWYGGQLIKNGEYTPQEVLAVFFNVLVGAMTLGQTSPSVNALACAQGVATDLFNVIERQSNINPFLCTDNMMKVQDELSPVRGDLEIKNVSFSYPSRPDITILKDISFSVPSGSTVALVGHSGSGKSTSIGLIERFYDPNIGQILLDGIDIRTISTEFLRGYIGLVGQEPALFATSIKNNIIFGLPSDIALNSQDLQTRVEEACKKAMIHDFIISLPKKYETLVGEKGSQLSGGQKQRISIARAIIKNPKILLLDEATSALDTESERSVQLALDAASQDRTTVVVAHRLSTIRRANLILVFDKGTIVERGTHEELLNLGGLYYDLVRAQTVRMESDQLPVDNYEEPIPSPLPDTLLDIDDDDPDNDDGIFKLATVAESIVDKEEFRIKKLQRQSLPALRIFKLGFPWWPLLIAGIIGAMIDGAAFPVYSVVLSRATQSFFDIMTPGREEQGKTNINFWSLMFVVLGIVCFISGTLKIGALYSLGEQIAFQVRKNSFTTILHQEVAYFDDPTNNSGTLTARLSTEADQVQGLISKVLGAMMSALGCIVMGSSLAFSNGWKLALVALACLPLTAYGQLMGLSSLTSGNSKTKKIYLKVSQVAMESIINIRTVSGLSQERLFYADYLARVDKAHQTATRGFMVVSLGYGIAMGTPHLTNALVFWYGTTLVVSGEYTYLNMFQVVMAVMFTGMSIGFLSAETTTYVKSKVAALEVFELWDRIPEINSSSQVGSRIKSVKGNLSVEGAHFAYPSRPDVPVLQGLDLSVIENKKVALVGASGSGKSTIVSLAQRFYDLPRGILKMEGIPIKDWNVEHLRSHISMVGQEPILFDMTIAENIAYGAKRSVTQEDIEEVAKMANAHNFILNLPDGYQTRTGERGNQLSGGQKQRIAIARSLLLRPKLLLLDEATSALDSQSESIVQAALDNASLGRTTITIAHRLSTIQDYDLIIVMKAGRRVEMGTHEELLNLRGYYYSLVHQQSLTATLHPQ